ncbi:Metalloprotease [Daldinia sp. FL1419]|nr:Metalloprotease [Daldinia sp. FL1419]
MYPNSSVCLSQSCIQASAAIFSNLDSNFQNIDPCTNFEQLVCGGLRERNVIPAWELHLGEITTLTEKNGIFMRNILEAPSEPSWISPGSIDEKNFKKLVAGYNACLNETAIAEKGVQPLVTFLGNITETFPVTTEELENPTRFDAADYEAFSKTYLYFAQHSSFPFLTIGIDYDPADAETYIPTIAPTTAPLSSELYENEEVRSAYEKALAQAFAGLLPTDELKAKAKELARSLVDLEQQIAAIIPVPSQEPGPIPVTTLDNATQLAPEFNLASLFKTISPSPIEKVSYNLPEYSASLSQVLANTTKPAIQAYFMRQAISGFQSAVDGPEVESLREFASKLSGEKPYIPERWRTCVTEADSKTAWLLSKPYVEAKYTDAIRKTLEEMTTRIQKRLAKNIDGIEWMTDKVKAIARHKVESIYPKLGYPTAGPNLEDAQSLNGYYADYVVSDSYFNNEVSYSKWLSKSTSSLYGTKKQKGSWPSDAGSSLTINAFYTPFDNAIIISNGILQPLLLHPEVPAYLNYGGLGFILGHEFTHSLDSTGRMYDERGVFKDWWDDESEAAFNKRAECLVKQYSSSNVTLSDGTQVPVNGTQTLGENIADTGGINTAYDAWLDKRREDPASDFDMPGLSEKFTREQLFYVSAAQFFCDKSGDAAKQVMLADAHSPSDVRIQNMMENSDGFRQAFNCPVKKPTCVIY